MTFQFTRQDFVREWHNMRDFMGSRTFWAKPVEQRDLALKGFTFVYCNADIQESDKMTFASTMQEYTAREGMMLRLEFNQLLP